ncbi:KpsF/GutQ family sugar-phosphate isomerase [Tistrella bauzanensis]|nr:KpsF/GutQ family sugar-phosphate isomerase [Tistrella bauzanensis]
MADATRRAIAAGEQTLALEAAGLEALRAGLGVEFGRAVDRLHATTGRVIVTGMGKSGHVGAKIAATLASTGTPAQFVHPAEASHGDLGMITRSDAVLALSNSGATPELSDILAHTRRFAIPLVGITARAGSPLAEAADVALILPAVPEACPLRLAPTTSTTMTLALGDALAMALLDRRGFTAEDFRVFHPGGKLGARLIKVADIMHGPEALPLITPDRPMSEALIEISARSFGCVGVVDGQGRLAGIVTDGDLRRHMGPDLTARPVGEVMTADPKTIRVRALAAEALAIMNDFKITALFAVDDEGRPAGILHVHDCLRAGVA